MVVLSNQPLTAREQTTVDYLDSAVAERLRTARAGAWVEVRVDKSTTTRVLARVKWVIESRGRQVGVFEDADNWRLVLPPLAAQLPPVQNLATVAPTLPAATGTPRVLIRLPTRGRPEQAVAAVQAYRDMAGCPVTIEVILDADDERLLASEVLQRLVALGAVVTVGLHRSKVEATNGGQVTGWDILILGSDDMVPVVDGYAKIFADELVKHFPYFDGAVFADDGYSGGRCCTMPVFGRRLYEQFTDSAGKPYIFEPAYRALCCDVEQTIVLRTLGRLVYIDRLLVEHRHPATGKAAFDALYDKNEHQRGQDEQTFAKRQSMRRPHAQCGFGVPPLALSICIATLPERRQQLDRLVDYLYRQIVQHAPRQVEVLTDDGPGAIGAKRQRLIERARGHYVAHVDDDDWVRFDYVYRIVGAIETSDYAADCVALSGSITTDGGPAATFHHSVEHREWCTTSDGVFLRSPNHLNPVRRELALQAGFPTGSSHGEDHEFSRRLLPLLRHEVSAGPVPLYYYWFRTKVLGR